MQKVTHRYNNESGQTLIFVVIIMMIMSITLGSLLQFTFASYRSAKIREERTLELYAADAGIEDALYQIKHEDEMGALQGLDYGDAAFSAGTPDTNERNVLASIEKVWIPEDLLSGWDTAAPTATTDKSDELVVVGMLQSVTARAASDNFESGDWSGGEGWANPWSPTGSATMGSSLEPRTGNFCLKLVDSNGSVTREANIPKYLEPRLQFWAKAVSFEEADAVECQVSSNGIDWDSMLTWSDGNDTGSYAFVDIDLSAYGGQSEASPLWIRFWANLAKTTAAWDDFNSGGISGGEGWLTNWELTGWESSGASNAQVLTSGSPHSPSYHLRLRGSSGDSRRGEAKRTVDLSGFTNPHLRFWAKSSGFDSGDNTKLKVKAGTGTQWNTVKTWTTNQGYTCWDIDLSSYAGDNPSSNQVWIFFDAAMNRTDEYFYVDDIEIVEGDTFYVDDLWMGRDIDTCTIEVAYTDPDLGSANMDRLGVWMPRFCEYLYVVDSVDIPAGDPGILPNTYSGGTILEWDFNPSIDLSDPVGGSGAQVPIVRSITFAYRAAIDPEGMFVWMEAHGVSGQTYASWDKGYEFYKAVSEASSEIWGSNTRIQAYVAQGELNKRNVVTFGNYVATGSPLMVDKTGSEKIREQTVDPRGSPIFVDGIWYSGRSTFSTVPADAEVKAAWLYWSAFQRDSSVADEDVSFMYPKFYGPETFEVDEGNGNDAYVTYAQTTWSEPIVDLPADVIATLSPKRWYTEVLGTIVEPEDGNNTFFTNNIPILQSPDAKVEADGFLLTEGTDYILNYNTGNITIIDDSVSGEVTIDYSVTGTDTLVEGADYTVDYDNGVITMTDDTLIGTVSVGYWAQHWEYISHEAYDRYGTELEPMVENNSDVGWSYVCFRDVTDLLRASPGNTGNGEFAVADVSATLGSESGGDWVEWSYSGWSIVIVYQSDSEPARQFYLYDPIHNNNRDGYLDEGECPFYIDMDSTTNFTLKDFYPPSGSVEGKLTYFVGEGDDVYDNDSITFRGITHSWSYLSGENNPWNDVVNDKSTTAETGIDIDTFDITDDVGSDTTAELSITNETDSWNLAFIVLAFKTDIEPKKDYAFDVAAITYRYEIGTNR